MRAAGTNRKETCATLRAIPQCVRHAAPQQLPSFHLEAGMGALLHRRRRCACFGLIDYDPGRRSLLASGARFGLLETWRQHAGSLVSGFYQGYTFPQFGIDKRKAHYSNLICAVS